MAGYIWLQQRSLITQIDTWWKLSVFLQIVTCELAIYIIVPMLPQFWFTVELVTSHLVCSTPLARHVMFDE